MYTPVAAGGVALNKVRSCGLSQSTKLSPGRASNTALVNAKTQPAGVAVLTEAPVARASTGSGRPVVNPNVQRRVA